MIKIWERGWQIPIDHTNPNRVTFKKSCVYMEVEDTWMVAALNALEIFLGNLENIRRCIIISVEIQEKLCLYGS